jgi:hypothetical protein
LQQRSYNTLHLQLLGDAIRSLHQPPATLPNLSVGKAIVKVSAFNVHGFDDKDCAFHDSTPSTDAVVASGRRFKKLAKAAAASPGNTHVVTAVNVWRPLDQAQRMR